MLQATTCLHKKKKSAELGIQYAANTQAWMTSSLSNTWLLDLDNYAGKTSGRKILHTLLQGMRSEIWKMLQDHDKLCNTSYKLQMIS
ncbi:hypothetical protein, partial [Escherichia coli]|uniref:hypothetical protein n=1 Tax=Escherichia coli TaxID=562 RepID=UPI003D66089B